MENPKIRFKGFTKDWEQRKLGEFVDSSDMQIEIFKDQMHAVTSGGDSFF